MVEVMNGPPDITRVMSSTEDEGETDENIMDA